MNIKIIGNIMSITSTINFDQLQKYTEKKPLFITDENGKKIYGVAAEPSAQGSIAEVGTSFSHKNAAGFAALNIPLPANLVDDITDYVISVYGPALTALKRYEPIINEKLADMAQAAEELATTITIE